jgi:hypothetical protein
VVAVLQAVVLQVAGQQNRAPESLVGKATSLVVRVVNRNLHKNAPREKGRATNLKAEMPARKLARASPRRTRAKGSHKGLMMGAAAANKQLVKPAAWLPKKGYQVSLEVPARLYQVRIKQQVRSVK